MTHYDDDVSDGTERCDSCRADLELGEPYTTHVLGPVPGRDEPAVVLWCLDCDRMEAA